MGISIIEGGHLPVINIDSLVVIVKLNIVLIPKGIEASDSVCISLLSDNCGNSQHLQMFRVSGFDGFPSDDTINFGNHINTDHFLRPALEVPDIEARDVRGRES